MVRVRVRNPNPNPHPNPNPKTLRRSNRVARGTHSTSTSPQECNNWYSCTYPSARFTTSFFVCRILGDERHHILNADYVVRRSLSLQPCT